VVLAETQLAAAGSSVAMVVGETYGSDGKFDWTRIVAEYRLLEHEHGESLPVAAYQVTVVVEWPGRILARQLDLSTIKLDRRAGFRG
jgi:hypothetical protein